MKAEGRGCATGQPFECSRSSEKKADKPKATHVRNLKIVGRGCFPSFLFGIKRRKKKHKDLAGDEI